MTMTSGAERHFGSGAPEAEAGDSPKISPAGGERLAELRRSCRVDTPGCETPTKVWRSEGHRLDPLVFDVRDHDRRTFLVVFPAPSQATYEYM